MNALGGRTVWLAGLTVAIGLALRLAYLDTSTLHGDEALYAAYALHVVRTGDLFILHWVGFQPDKTLILFWVIAASIGALGDTPIALRMVGLVSDSVTILSLFYLGTRLQGSVAGIFSAGFFAVSPLAVLYGSSAFQDPLAIALGVLGLLASASGHYLIAGILLGLGAGTKILGLIFLPSALLLAYLYKGDFRASVRTAWAFGISLGLILGMTFLRTLFLDQPFRVAGTYEYGILQSSQWLPRLVSFSPYLDHLVPSGLPFLLLIAGVLSGVAVALRDTSAANRLVLVSFVAIPIAYVVLLVVIRNASLDRYFLFVLPTICLAAGYGLARVAHSVAQPQLRIGIATVILASFIVASLVDLKRRLNADVSLGPQSSATSFSGYRALCKWLTDNAAGHVVWNKSLSWHFAYCLQGSGVISYWFDKAADIKSTNPGNSELVALSRVDENEATGILNSIAASGWSVELLRGFYGANSENLWVYRISRSR